jgi:hypothetical protein
MSLTTKFQYAFSTEPKAVQEPEEAEQEFEEEVS